jgi:hypothetical protein
LFAWEIVPVEVSTGRGRPSVVIDKDEGLGKVNSLGTTASLGIALIDLNFVWHEPV